MHAGHLADVGRKPDRRKMAHGALRRRLRQQAEPRGEFERAGDAERDRLAVQQPVGKSRRRLEGVAEGVAEVEQRALAGLALVARDDPGLAAARDRDRVLARRTPEELPPANTSCQFASSQAKKPASPSRPNFATSA